MLKVLGKILLSFGRAAANNSSGSIYSNSQELNAFGNANIQLQDDLGNWRTCQGVPNIPAYVINGMKQTASEHPGKRVRAVNDYGNIVDIL